MVREATDVMEESWPSGACLQGPASNRPERHWLKTVVVSVGEKSGSTRQVWIEKASTSEPSFRRRNLTSRHQNRGPDFLPGEVHRRTCLPDGRCPAYRWRELDPGAFVELRELGSVM